jgi:hypothetical protein
MSDTKDPQAANEDEANITSQEEMILMIRMVQNLLQRYFGLDRDLHIQSFNLLGLAGITAGVVVAVVSFLTGAIANSAINLVVSVLAFLLLRLAGERLSYHFCCMAVIIAVFMCAFPVMFLQRAGTRAGCRAFSSLPSFSRR